MSFKDSYGWEGHLDLWLRLGQGPPRLKGGSHRRGERSLSGPGGEEFGEPRGESGVHGVGGGGSW